jgi:hypothetical protein
LRDYQTVGFYGHAGPYPDVQFGAFYFVNCSSTGCALSFDGVATNMFITGCTGDGYLPLDSTNVFVTDTDITTTNARAAGDGSICRSLTIVNSVLESSCANGICIYAPGLQNLTIADSVLTATNGGWGIFEASSLTKFVSISNNITATWAWYDLPKEPSDGALLEFTSEGNDFNGFLQNATEMSIGGTNYSAPFSTYQSALGADSTSTFTLR